MVILLWWRKMAQINIPLSHQISLAIVSFSNTTWWWELIFRIICHTSIISFSIICYFHPSNGAMDSWRTLKFAFVIHDIATWNILKDKKMNCSELTVRNILQGLLSGTIQSKSTKLKSKTKKNPQNYSLYLIIMKMRP